MKCGNSSSVDNPLRSPRDSSFQRCHPTISNAHKKLGNTETPGLIISSVYVDLPIAFVKRHLKPVDVQLLRNKLVAAARKCIRNNGTIGEVYGSMEEAYQQMQSPLIHQGPSRVCADQSSISVYNYTFNSFLNQAPGIIRFRDLNSHTFKRLQA